MAGSYYGRRLSELLQEQQEPFLLLVHGRGSGSSASEKGDDAGSKRYALGGALRRALRRWDVTGITTVAGCFLPCGGGGAAGGVERFRQLRRGHDDDDCDEEGGGGARRLSPVSVLDVLHADDDDDSSWEEDDDDRPSTSSVSSPPLDLDLAMTTSGDKSMDGKDEEHSRTIISSSWETVAADIARIPLLLELDLSGGQTRDRRRRQRLGDEEEEAEEEAWRVVESIEAMIFEEMLGHAVRAMID